MTTACGPERAPASEEELLGQTQQIAQDYAATGDLDAARSALAALDVANGNQWLIYVAETTVAEGGDPALAASLVRLSDALGLESAALAQYALQNNLLEGLSAAADAAPGLVSPGKVAVAPEEEAEAESASAAVAEEADTAASAGAQATAPDDDAAEDGADGASSLLPAPTATPAEDTQPFVRATLSMNVRNGPGTTYEIIDLFDDDEELTVVAKNNGGDWWQVELNDGRLGWVYGQLVEQQGDFAAVAVAADIPPPPEPTATPVPAEPEPIVAEPEPAEEAAPAADPSGTPHFTLVSRRLWSKSENGGCAGQHLLRINVIDANGVRLNGVALQGIYVGEVLVTGDQGKGDGIIEYDLHGSGEGFFVLRNDDGRDVTSDRAEGFTTRSRDIPKDVLIEAGYCSDSADCDVFYGSYGCQGHHSYEATFQRNY